MLFGFGVSFFRWTIIEPPVFVGLDNYTHSSYGDPLAAKVIGNSSIYTLGALPVSVLLPLGLAVLLNTALRATSFFRGVYFLPLVTSAVATATIFKWIYASRLARINQLIGLFGIPRQDWLFDERLVLPALIIAAIWHRVPLNIIFYLAALQGVDRAPLRSRPDRRRQPLAAVPLHHLAAGHPDDLLRADHHDDQSADRRPST